mgnify:CR=1 FL=1
MLEPKRDGMKGVGLYFVSILILLLILMMVWNQVGGQEVWLSDQEAQALLDGGAIQRLNPYVWGAENPAAPCFIWKEQTVPRRSVTSSYPTWSLSGAW